MPAFDSETLSAIFLTLKLASLTTLCLLVLALPLAWWLSQTRSAWRSPVAALLSLPLVLPPAVLGFYLLVALGPQGPMGRLTTALGWAPLTFSFGGLLLGSVIYSMPFAVQPLQRAFESVGQRPLEVAATLRASPLDTFFSVVLPQSVPGLLTAAILSFAHTVGEFGVVLMIGGNIPRSDPGGFHRNFQPGGIHGLRPGALVGRGLVGVLLCCAGGVASVAAAL